MNNRNTITEEMKSEILRLCDCLVKQEPFLPDISNIEIEDKLFETLKKCKFDFLDKIEEHVFYPTEYINFVGEGVRWLFETFENKITQLMYDNKEKVTQDGKYDFDAILAEVMHAIKYYTEETFRDEPPYYYRIARNFITLMHRYCLPCNIDIIRVQKDSTCYYDYAKHEVAYDYLSYKEECRKKRYNILGDIRDSFLSNVAERELAFKPIFCEKSLDAVVAHTYYEYIVRRQRQILEEPDRYRYASYFLEFGMRSLQHLLGINNNDDKVSSAMLAIEQFLLDAKEVYISRLYQGIGVQLYQAIRNGII